MKHFLFCLSSAMLLASCWNKDLKVIGYAPVYSNIEDVKKITIDAAKPYELAGKIFVIGSHLFQVETGKGFHITDISDPASPQKKGFVHVLGCSEIAVKNGYIYTNNLQDLVVLTIANEKVNVVRRVPNAFEALLSNARPPERGRFECPDSRKGVVIAWEKRELDNPQCFY